MVNLILSLVVCCKSIARKNYGFIPAAVFIALYELVCHFQVQMMDYAGLLERILATLILASVLFVCLRKQLPIGAVLPAALVALLRWSWMRVFDWYRQVMQYPGSDATALLRQASMVRGIFDCVIFVMLLMLEILMLRKLRKI